jgi:hypothetical protein
VSYTESGIINTEVWTLSRLLKLVVIKYIINKVRLDVKLLFFGARTNINCAPSSSEIDLEIIILPLIISQISVEIHRQMHVRKGWSAQDPSRWTHGSLNIRNKVLVRHTVPLWNIDVCRLERRNPWVASSGSLSSHHESIYEKASYYPADPHWLRATPRPLPSRSPSLESGLDSPVSESKLLTLKSPDLNHSLPSIMSCSLQVGAMVIIIND